MLMKKKKEKAKLITGQLEKEIDDISKLREDTNKKIVPYHEQVQQLALTGHSGEKQSKTVSNIDKGFTRE